MTFQVHPLLVATACLDAEFAPALHEFCLSRFRADMDSIEPELWCNWEKTLGSYRDLSNCTQLVAAHLGCAWPGPIVDRFFVAVHRFYFQDCPVSGRAVQDPPSSILCSFIAVPILVTLLMTLLVVWRSKCPEGVV